MTLESQVTSLELSKRLRELGVKQESLFYWETLEEYYGHSSSHINRVTYGKNVYIPDRHKYYSAFTASELLELLPKELDNTYLTISFSNTATCVCYTDQKGIFLEHYIETENEESLEDILSKMLIYLIENNLWEIK